MSSLAESIDRASRSFTGQLLQPADAGYDGWRRVHNGLIDKHPAAIARCHGVADVVDAVKLARTLDLDVVIIEHLHGASTTVPVASTACTLRTTGFNVLFVSQWTSAEETERGVAWARDTFSSLSPHLAPTRYLNYLEADAVDPAAVAHAPNLDRLRRLKTKWDPDNFFRQKVNILPRSAGTA